MKSLILVVAISHLLALSASAQTVEGYVLDISSNKPVGFAYIGIQDKPMTGTASNEDGLYRLDIRKVSDSDSILVSHINYISRKFPVSEIRKSGIRIFLTENNIQLNELLINSSEDFDILQSIISETKKNTHFPMTSVVYYREFVKENKSYNKFADGILSISYEKKANDNDAKIKVLQSRAFRLPKDEDDQFELMSLVKVQSVVETQFMNLLNRFTGEHKNNYHFYFLAGEENNDDLFLIEPKKEADRSDNQVYYKAIIKTDKEKNITDVRLDLDSLCRYEKSLLGIKFNIPSARITISIKKINGLNYVAMARYNFALKVTSKKFTQVEDFASEFITLETKPLVQEVKGSDIFKKSALYKNGTRYDHPFWKGINLPVLSKEEDQLVSELESKEKEIKK